MSRNYPCHVQQIQESVPIVHYELSLRGIKAIPVTAVKAYRVVRCEGFHII
jgi:hypothetical protein